MIDLQELKTITSADLAGKLHAGQPDTPDIGADAMQELFDAHPNLNTAVINENAQRQNANNAEVDAKLLDLAAEDVALGERIDLKADTEQVNAKFAELDVEDELLHQRIDTKANDAEIKGVLANLQAELEDKANSSDVLSKDNAEAFTPTADYQPATKKYVDDLGLKAGAVTSVFGRAGDVKAQAGDYTAEMVGAAKAIAKVSVSITASGWSENNGIFSKSVSIPRGTSQTLVALQPTAEQLLAMQEEGVSALMVNNNDGAFFAVAVGAALPYDMTIQATLTEVTA